MPRRGLSTAAEAFARKARFNAGAVRGNRQTPRMYDAVRVKEHDFGSGRPVWSVEMDGRALTTSREQFIFFPSKLVACSVAAEWERQGAFIQPTSMPLMHLTSSAVDGFTGEARSKNINDVCNYLATDTVCFRADLIKLREKQDLVLDPLIDWVEQRFDVQLGKSYGLDPPEHSPNAHPMLLQELDKMDPWVLAVFDSLVKVTKSFVIPLALVHNRLNAKQVYIAGRIEEDFNILNWGEVEGGHDLDLHFTKFKTYAATSFLKMLRLDGVAYSP